MNKVGALVALVTIAVAMFGLASANKHSNHHYNDDDMELDCARCFGQRYDHFDRDFHYNHGHFSHGHNNHGHNNHGHNNHGHNNHGHDNHGHSNHGHNNYGHLSHHDSGHLFHMRHPLKHTHHGHKRQQMKNKGHGHRRQHQSAGGGQQGGSFSHSGFPHGGSFEGGESPNKQAGFLLGHAEGQKTDFHSSNEKAEASRFEGQQNNKIGIRKHNNFVRDKVFFKDKTSDSNELDAFDGSSTHVDGVHGSAEQSHSDLAHQAGSLTGLVGFEKGSGDNSHESSLF